MDLKNIKAPDVDFIPAEAIRASLERHERNLTRLSYWFPLVEAAGIPVPATVIVPATPSEIQALWTAFDGVEADFRTLADNIRGAASRVGGYPLFLRTDLTSAKHDWKRSCCVTDPSKLEAHIFTIAEFSACVDLEFGTWVVREMLRTTPAFTAFWGDMPITREFRFFVRDGAIEHWQPYWPPASIDGHTDATDWRERLGGLSALQGATYEQLADLTKQASAAVPGFWSVDWLHTSDRGWVLTDMAEGDVSYRWDANDGEQAVASSQQGSDGGL